MASFAIEAFNLTAEWCEQIAGLLKTSAPKVCDTIVGYLPCMMHAGFCHIHWNSLFLLLKYPFFFKKKVKLSSSYQENKLRILEKSAHVWGQALSGVTSTFLFLGIGKAVLQELNYTQLAFYVYPL